MAQDLNFGQRLFEAGERLGRLCVGIDPHPYLLKQWGLSDDVAGLREFSSRCVEAFDGSAALVKPQVAFFERFGAEGLAVLEDVLGQLKERGTLSLADAKRGDIGSTMEAYATSWLDDASPLVSDAVTLSPFLGVQSLAQTVELAQRGGRGVFILAATSNPEARTLQSARLGDGRSISQYVVDECARFNREQNATVLGSVGVVVGATVEIPPSLEDLKGPILLPGVGAQGASASDVARIVGSAGGGAFASVSRAVAEAGPKVENLRKRVSAIAAEFSASVN